MLLSFYLFLFVVLPIACISNSSTNVKQYLIMSNYVSAAGSAGANRCVASNTMI